MVLSPEGKSKFRPIISFRYPQWKVLAHSHHSSWFLWQLKSSESDIHSEQPRHVQLNETNGPTTEKH